ncbi:hypothetical protein [Streptomyces sp. NPDC006463]|uniref:hypothetical protein n=1 Tax=Streptomyces sp. NPDC006463 TaxID=3364746 RepID=UPI00368D2412
MPTEFPEVRPLQAVTGLDAAAYLGRGLSGGLWRLDAPHAQALAVLLAARRELPREAPSAPSSRPRRRVLGYGWKGIDSGR